ncbi:hypothetical protein FHT82_002466 [Rhizobium sp. BK275]|uniref:TniQ family protein n=1 Tax=Rhizobium sp. BK275 TaxID=2587077 RepID=UPI00160881B7|nr:TniQ family protein [Rhizobium sp. BK275]MBB3389726.1 hypothetical protein [Rhizobium sp. BK275]
MVLPFSRWDFAPEIDEPAHGYARRLVGAHGLNTVVTFNVWNQIDSDYVNPKASLELLLKHPLPAEWVDRLKHATPIKGEDAIVLAGNSVRHSHISRHPRRWCPGCLHQSPHHRVWWEFTFLNRCPVHDIEFVSVEPDGRSASWTWTDFANARSGEPLGYYVAPVRPSGLGGYVLGRLGFLPRAPNVILDAATLGAAVDLCKLVGKFLTNQRHHEVPEGEERIDIGYQAVAMGVASFASSILDWLSAYPRHIDCNGSLRSVFGWIVSSLWMIDDTNLRAVVRRTLSDARGLDIRRHDGPVRNYHLTGQEISFQGMANRLGMSARGVQIIADELTLRDPTRFRIQIDLRDEAAISQFAAELLTPTQAAAKLGVHQDALRHLTHCGYLKVFKGTEVGNRPGARFDPRRIEKITSRVDSLPTKDQGAGVTINAYRKRYGLSRGQIAVGILEGAIAIAERIADRVGFNSLRIAVPLEEWHGSTSVKSSSVTLAQAQAILNLSGFTVRSLAEAGYLGPVGRNGATKVLHRSHVRRFASEYAKVADFAHGLEAEPSAFHSALMEHGVQPLAWPKKGGKQRAECVVRRSDVQEALGGAPDPSVIHDEVFTSFWKDLVGKLEVACRHLHLPENLPAGGQRIWQNTVFSLYLRYDAAQGVLTGELVPSKAAREAVSIDLLSAEKATQVESFVKRLRISINAARLQQRRLKKAPDADQL